MFLPFTLLQADLTKLVDMTPDEIGSMVGSRALGQDVKRYVGMMPMLDLEAKVLPITNTIVKIVLGKLTYLPC